MEKNIKDLLEQHVRGVGKIQGPISVDGEVNSTQVQNKALNDLKMEEQILKAKLESLRKENFTLKASIPAWKATYEQKKNELTEAEAKLNEIYNEIWSEREEFCARADEFNNRYGILSKWWEKRMDEIFNPKRDKNEKYLQELEKLEREIAEMERELEDLKKDEPKILEPPQADINLINRKETMKELSSEPDDNNAHMQENEMEIEKMENDTPFFESEASPCNEDLFEKSESWKKEADAVTSESAGVIKGSPKKKKVRFVREHEKITTFDDDPESLKFKFFSMVDQETVRKANRFMNRRTAKSSS